MSCVHYKFFSKLAYSTVIFDGSHISLCDLKRQIMRKEKLTGARSDLQISNAQTKEEFTDGNALIPKNSSVIVRRIPKGGSKFTSKAFWMSRTEPVSETAKGRDVVSSASPGLAQFTKTGNLAEANASEEEKITAMMAQSGHEYHPANYRKKPLGPTVPSDNCLACCKAGPSPKKCPMHADKRSQSGPRIRRSSGIPTSFMMEVKNPHRRGAMLTKTGKYAVPIIDAEAYAIGKKEKPPFLAEDPSPCSEKEDPIPEELLCLICQDIMTDAAVVPCCGNSYCDECIRTELLESDEHTCPTCHRDGVSPDALVANKCLRRAVEKFKNQSGPGRSLGKQSLPHPQPTTSPSPLLQRDPQPRRRSLLSRQQDPLANQLTSSSAQPSPSRFPFASGPLPWAPSEPGNPSSAPALVLDSTVMRSTSEPSEKADSPLQESENQLFPAAALTSEHCKGASSMAITSLSVEEKGYQAPGLENPSLLVHSSLEGQSISTAFPGTKNAVYPGGGRPGWVHSNKPGYLVPPPEQVRRGEVSCQRNTDRGQHHSQRSQRTPGPSRPGFPAFGSALQPPWFSRLPLRPPLPPGEARPQGSHHFLNAQALLAGCSVPQPGFSPVPAHHSSPWVSSGMQTASADCMPTSPAPPLSRREFFREQRRLKEEEEKRSKLVRFPKGNSKEQMGYRQIPKERRRSFSRASSPCRGSSYARRSDTSRNQVPAPHSPSLPLRLSAAHTLGPIWDHPRTPGEAKTGANIAMQGSEIMDITDLGPGHLPIAIVIYGHDLLKGLWGQSLPQNVLDLKETQRLMTFIDTEKF